MAEVKDAAVETPVTGDVRALIEARLAACEAAERALFERLAACEAAERALAEAAVLECCESVWKSCSCASIDLSSEAPSPARRRAFNRLRLPEDLKLPDDKPHPPNLQAANLSFAARVVIAVRDKFGGEAPMVYRAAKMTRQAYSQIVSDETHRVDKKTALRFAFALKCSLDEAHLLLKSAGFAFSNANRLDCVLQACLEVKPPVWNLDDVNLLLREYRVDFQF